MNYGLLHYYFCFLPPATQVNFKLRGLAEEMGPEVAKFKQLANSVEEFTYCLLDPLKSRKSSHEDRSCEQFGDYSLDFILDDAIEFEQKKVTLLIKEGVDQPQLPTRN